LADFPQHLMIVFFQKKWQLLVELLCAKKNKNFQFANFEKFPNLGPDLAMKNDIA
jgi:hypothetical protein